MTHHRMYEIKTFIHNISILLHKQNKMHIYSSIAVSMNKWAALFWKMQPTYHFFHENKTKTFGGKTSSYKHKKTLPNKCMTE